MATSIRSGIVKQLRNDRGWTQEELAKRAGLNKQSIFRIEQGRYRGTRHETVVQLCNAFAVDEAIITGKPADSLSSEEDNVERPGAASQINLRIDNAARNALTLTARRYGVQLSEIVEIAPFLFFLAAERSLQRRSEKLGEVNDAIDQVEKLRAENRYFPINIPGNEDLINCETESIKKNDIFGRRYEVDTNSRSFRYVRNFDDNRDNPFAVFLGEELQHLKDASKKCDEPIVGTFAGWHPDIWSSPGYEICSHEAVDMVGNDSDAVRAILNGNAPIHEIPKRLRGVSQIQLADWAKEKSKENEIDLVDLV